MSAWVANLGFAGLLYSRGRSGRVAGSRRQVSSSLTTGHVGMRARRVSRLVLGSRWVASNPRRAFLGSERSTMSPFWALVWRVYDRPVLVRVLPSRVAPWLFGRMIGAKGRRMPL